jgi:circadian clock protein KaiC
MEQHVPAFGVKRRRLAVVKLRGVRFDDGYHDYKIETGGVCVYPRMVAAGHGSTGPRDDLTSGLAELDDLLKGGLSRGTSTVVTGPAGSGKSMLAAQYVAAAAARGERTAVFDFDESESTFVTRCEGVGIPVREHIATGRVRLVQVDPGELSPGEFAHMVRQSVERDGVSVVVIDSLNGYLNATPDERFLLVQLHELLTYLGNFGVCTLLLVAQHGMLGGGQSPLDASYLADTVVMLRYFEFGGQVRKALSVVKKRTGPHEQTIRDFKVTPDGLRVGQPLADFHGVLTGVPEYTGGGDALLRDAAGGGGDDGDAVRSARKP